MFKASVILKNAREDKDLSIEEVSKKLKISVKYLQAIEGEQKSEFPDEPYCSLMIKDYANFLGLNGEDVISLFRRDFASISKSATAINNQFFFTPQFTFRLATFGVIILFIGYIVVEYLKFNRPPELKVDWPLASNSAEISGVTDPESTIRVNNDLIIVDQLGKFHKNLDLSRTNTKVVIESKSPSGKTTVVEKTY